MVSCTRFVATMKTNPIGVRFRVDILEKLKNEHSAETPQKALNFLERFFVTHNALAKDLKQPLRSNADQGAGASDQAKVDNFGIWEQIKAIEAEKIPELRNKSDLGRKSWRLEQEKRIQELKNQLK